MKRKIKPRSTPTVNHLRAIWHHREILYFLFWRDVKVRYKQAFFGITWAILTPIVQALVFALVFGVFFKIPSGQIPYLPLIFAGFVFWNFFSNAISSATFSLTSNTDLVTKASFPKEIVVIATVLARLPDLLASIIILFVVLVFYHLPLSLDVFWIVPLLVIEILLALGIGFYAAAINVYFRDISALVPLILMAWLFLTPVIYTLDSIPAKFHLYAKLNPMTGVLEGIRSSLLLHQPPDVFALLISLAATLFVLISGYWLFKKLERGFADVI